MNLLHSSTAEAIIILRPVRIIFQCIAVKQYCTVKTSFAPSIDESFCSSPERRQHPDSGVVKGQRGKLTRASSQTLAAFQCRPENLLAENVLFVGLQCNTQSGWRTTWGRRPLAPSGLIYKNWRDLILPLSLPVSLKKNVTCVCNQL